MSGVEVINRGKPPPQMWRCCFESMTWWLSEATLVTAPGIPSQSILNAKFHEKFHTLIRVPHQVSG
jgi:hypothetical protein